MGDGGVWMKEKTLIMFKNILAVTSQFSVLKLGSRSFPSSGNPTQIIKQPSCARYCAPKRYSRDGDRHGPHHHGASILGR